MATVNLYSKTQCDAVIPKGDAYGMIFNDCIRDVKELGYYEYDAGWQLPSFQQALFYAAEISVIVIAIILAVRFFAERQKNKT
tara:strand:+ start:175 stop:423 length:249 start_codon:yes stop_codon:yes gene_type:complete